MTYQEIFRLVQDAISHCLTLEIVYVDRTGMRTTREISEIEFSQTYGSGYIEAYCHLRDNRRSFKISNIEFARVESFDEEEEMEEEPTQSTNHSYNKEMSSGLYLFDPNKPIYPLYGDDYSTK